MLLGLLLLSAHGASAVTVPTTPDQVAAYSRLQAEIVSVHALEKKLTALAEAARLEGAKINGPDPVVVARNDALKLDLENQVLLARTEAIASAVTAFDLTPARPTGVLVVGVVEGRPARWLPMYAEQAARWIQDADGKPKLIPPPKRAATGITWPDGAITLTASAFLSPAYLAAVIVHETVHFEQHTTRGLGDKISPKQMEFSAHMAMLANKDKLGLSTGELVIIQKSMIEAMSRADGDYFIGVPDPSAVRPEPVRAGGDDEFLGAIRELPGVSEQTKQTVRREREEIESLIVREKAARRLAADRWLEDRKRSRAYLWGLAAEACSDPEKMAALADRGEIIPANIDAQDDSYGVTDTAGPRSLSSCQARVLDAIDAKRHSGARVYHTDFSAAARAYRNAHPTFGDRLGKLASNFAESFTNLSDGRRDGAVIDPDARSGRAPRSYSREPDCFVDSNGIRGCCVSNCQ